MDRGARSVERREQTPQGRPQHGSHERTDHQHRQRHQAPREQQPHHPRHRHQCERETGARGWRLPTIVSASTFCTAPTAVASMAMTAATRHRVTIRRRSGAHRSQPGASARGTTSTHDSRNRLSTHRAARASDRPARTTVAAKRSGVPASERCWWNDGNGERAATATAIAAGTSSRPSPTRENAPSLLPSRLAERRPPAPRRRT